MRNTLRWLLAYASLALCAPFAAFADPYVGVGVGAFDYSEDADGFLVLTDMDDNSSSRHLYGGFEFTKFLAVEGSWGTSGTFRDTVSMSLPLVNVVPVDVTGEYDILSARVLGFLPVGGVRLFAGVGAYKMSLESSGTVPGLGRVDVDSDESGSGYLLGLQFDLLRIGIRARYEKYETESNVDASDIGIGVSFRF